MPWQSQLFVDSSIIRDMHAAVFSRAQNVSLMIPVTVIPSSVSTHSLALTEAFVI